MNRRGATAMCVISSPTRPLEHAVLKIMYHVQLSKWSSKLFKFSEKGTQRRDGHVYCRLVNVYRTHHQPNAASIKIIRRFKIECSMKPIRRSRSMHLGYNGGVRSVSVDQSVA
jgi:hypothetical protein